MKVVLGSFLAGGITLAAGHAKAAVLYVNAYGNNPAPPYADWDTAATNIQDAVDAANAGDLVLVTNGVYQSGGRPATGLALTNRVLIDKALTVQSVNGPEVTIIEGYQVPVARFGTNAVRGACVADGAMLNGFTVAYGATILLPNNVTNADVFGGGVWCQSTNAMVSDCLIVSNCSSRYGGGAYSGTLNGCQITYNAVGTVGAGAVAFSVVTNSTINNNSLSGLGGLSGAGAYSSILSHCTLDENFGGGVYQCSLDHCMLGNNTNLNGGGASHSSLTACLIYGNQSTGSGGGVYNCSLTNCTLSNNWSAVSGGGAYFDSFDTNSPGENNILIGNACAQYGGGLYLFKIMNITGWTFLTNSAVRDGGGFYSTPLVSGISNCTFAGNSSGGNGGGFCPGSSGSPIYIRNCTFSGNVAQGNGGGAYNTALDYGVVSENHAVNGGGVYGYVGNCVVNGNSASANGGGVYYSVAVFMISPNCEFTNNSAMNGGAAYGGIFTNCIFAGNSAVTNGGAVAIGAMNHCLVISNQAAFGGGAFAGGSSSQGYPGKPFNYLQCDFIGNSATVDGGGSYNSYPSYGTNCNFISNSALNSGGGVLGGTFGSGMVCNNSALNGGGAYNTSLVNCEVVSNTATGNGGGLYSGGFFYCTVSNNIAGTNGGGGYGTVLINSLATRNSAANGGGIFGGGTLNNSTIAGNTATVSGGGVIGGLPTSCIVYDNTAPTGPNYTGGSSFGYCCTTPMPPTNNHNITNDPAFIDFSAGNFRLQTNSPCINLGNGGSAVTDLDGRNRYVGTIDIGAYEFQRPGIGEFIQWLKQHGLSTTGSADFLDSDGDGLNNWQEWLAGTEPTITSSVLRLLNPTFAENSTGVTLTWQSVTNRTYFVQRGGDLSGPSVFSIIQSNIVGEAGTTSYTDTNNAGTGPFFYRIGVQ